MKISNCSLDCRKAKKNFLSHGKYKSAFSANTINPELKQRIEEIVGEEAEACFAGVRAVKKGQSKTIEGKSRNLSAACWPGKRENEVSDAGRSFCDSRAHCSIMIEVFTRDRLGGGG